MPLHGTVGQLLNRLIAAGVGQRPVIFVTHRYEQATKLCRKLHHHLFLNQWSLTPHETLLTARNAACLQVAVSNSQAVDSFEYHVNLAARHATYHNKQPNTCAYFAHLPE